MSFNKSPWSNHEESDSSAKKGGVDFSKFPNFNLNFNIKMLVMVVCGLVAVWFSSGFYEVKEGEQAITMRFGKFVRLATPGLNYHMPYPIEFVIIEKTNMSRRIEIGYRSGSGTRSEQSAKGQDVSSESIMLTGDENIVSLNVDVMWHISDLPKYAFNVYNPELTVKLVTESAIREVIGNTPIDSALSSQKQQIADKVEKLSQSILDLYNIGVVIEQVQLLKVEPPVEVIDAYRDVQTARADKEREINKAETYSNDILPRARGEAAKITKEAEGYAIEVVARANGDVARYAHIYNQYKGNEDVMKTRLYLEAVSNLLSSADNKFVISKGNILPHLGLKDERAN